VAKVATSKAGGTISQQAVVQPWLAADAHGIKQTRVLTYFAGCLMIGSRLIVEVCWNTTSKFQHYGSEGFLMTVVGF
jgi:hypothetical protein